ncbi:MAG: hypothetical protein IPP43_02640 [Chitinophagaceae bacterium]|nr:hypothetical protein [Chitinophagaceae bacterium]
MKNIILLCVFCVSVATIYAQKQTFDITTYTPPKEWKRQNTESAIQFTKEDPAKGTYCLITLYKAIPGKTDTKENFSLAWETLVKGMVSVSAKPEMQPASTENGWTAESGYASFENEGNKGIALLITSTSLDKMVNIVILTNTDVFQNEISAFLESITLQKQIAGNNPPLKYETNSVKPQPKTTAAKKDDFAFNTTNFDDGWTSTVQENWVEVTKGNLKVLIHFPKEGTIFPADPDVLTNAAWNILVAPRYSNLKSYRTSYISTYDRPYLGMGYATENATGKKYLLFSSGRAKPAGWSLLPPIKTLLSSSINLILKP